MDEEFLLGNLNQSVERSFFDLNKPFDDNSYENFEEVLIDLRDKSSVENICAIH